MSTCDGGRWAVAPDLARISGTVRIRRTGVTEGNAIGAMLEAWASWRCSPFAQQLSTAAASQSGSAVAQQAMRAWLDGCHPRHTPTPDAAKARISRTVVKDVTLDRTHR